MRLGTRTSKLVGRGDTNESEAMPTASMRFRQRAWREFQRALDPLAPPKPLPMRRRP